MDEKNNGMLEKAKAKVKDNQKKDTVKNDDSGKKTTAIKKVTQKSDGSKGTNKEKAMSLKIDFAIKTSEELAKMTNEDRDVYYKARDEAIKQAEEFAKEAKGNSGRFVDFLIGAGKVAGVAAIAVGGAITGNYAYDKLTTPAEEGIGVANAGDLVLIESSEDLVFDD